jgi:hypothetical protein
VRQALALLWEAADRICGKGWLQAEPDVTAKALMQRLCEHFPDVYPTGSSPAAVRPNHRRFAPARSA